MTTYYISPFIPPAKASGISGEKTLNLALQNGHLTLFINYVVRLKRIELLIWFYVNITTYKPFNFPL